MRTKTGKSERPAYEQLSQLSNEGTSEWLALLDSTQKWAGLASDGADLSLTLASAPTFLGCLLLALFLLKGCSSSFPQNSASLQPKIISIS